MMRAPLMSSLGFIVALCACPEPGVGPGPGEGEGEGEGEDGVSVSKIGDVIVDADGVVNAAGIAVAVRNDGRFAVAFVSAPSAAPPVTCNLFGGGTVTEPRSDIVVADEQGDGTVRIRIVDSVPPVPGNPSVSLGVEPTSDALLVAYTGGEPADGACQGSDLMFAVESGATFTISTVAADAPTASDCRDQLDPLCNQGDCVGRNPGLAVDGDGNVAVSYIDQHFCFGETDIFSSDLEIALGTSAGLATESIATESGSGYFGDTAFTDDGRAIVGHLVLGSNTFEDENGQQYVVSNGIYAAVQQSDGSWIDSPLLERVATSSRVAAAFHPQTGAVIAFRDDENGQLLFYTSLDSGLSWTAGAIEQNPGTGRSPAIGFLSDGALIAAYSHCKDGSGGGDFCDFGEDGVRISVRPPLETNFSKFTFTGDDEDQDGIGVDMTIAADDTIVVSSFNASTSRIVVQRFEVTQ